MKDHKRGRAFLTGLILAICLCLLASEDVYAKKRSSKKGYSLGHFRLTVEETGKAWLKDKVYRIELTRSGKKIFEEESYVMPPEVKLSAQIPSKECRAMLIKLFSGGAHCCFTAILCTVCGREETAVMLDLLDSDELTSCDVNGDGRQEMHFLDMQFGYYDSEVSNLNLSFAASPAMYRLLVYDENRWRLDKPGEFNKYYSELMLKSKTKAELELSAGRPEQKISTADEPTASSAMEAVYYALMAGETESESEALLQRLLPPRWQQAKEKVFSDIKKKIQDLNPIVEQVVSDGIVEGGS